MEKIIVIDNKNTNYTIDENGKIKNILTNKILMGSFTRDGYQYVRLSFEKRKIRFLVHRLIAENFLNKPADNTIVNHKNGIKNDNRVNNLEWVTYSENIQHAYDNNLIKKQTKETGIYQKDLPNEEWKIIINYPDYEISNYGRIKSLKRKQPIILKTSIVNGYRQVILSYQGTTKHFSVHKLVYIHFIKNEDLTNFIIDHIDNNPLNNYYKNLRKVTASENVLYGFIEQNCYKYMRKVIAYKDNEKIGEYYSCQEAARQLKCDSSAIAKVCNGRYKHTHGYVFKYEEQGSTTTISKIAE